MPTYEYQCHQCKKKFDHFQRMSDAPLKKCVYCKGPVQRLIGSGAGLIFKGSGFYITDYKKTENRAQKTEDRGQRTEDKKEKAGEKKEPPGKKQE